jgi:hypothetical protein
MRSRHGHYRTWCVRETTTDGGTRTGFAVGFRTFPIVRSTFGTRLAIIGDWTRVTDIAIGLSKVVCNGIRMAWAGAGRGLSRSGGRGRSLGRESVLCMVRDGLLDDGSQGYRNLRRLGQGLAERMRCGLRRRVLGLRWLGEGLPCWGRRGDVGVLFGRLSRGWGAIGFRVLALLCEELGLCSGHGGPEPLCLAGMALGPLGLEDEDLVVIELIVVVVVLIWVHGRASTGLGRHPSFVVWLLGIGGLVLLHLLLFVV